jgi:hypothetical protein
MENFFYLLMDIIIVYYLEKSVSPLKSLGLIFCIPERGIFISVVAYFVISLQLV